MSLYKSSSLLLLLPSLDSDFVFPSDNFLIPANKCLDNVFIKARSLVSGENTAIRFSFPYL